MIALSIALGVVGLAAVIAARSVAMRWLSQRAIADDVGTRLDRLEYSSGVNDTLRADHTKLLEVHTQALSTLSERTSEFAEETRRLRLKRLGGA